jgi:hypothetical protein
MSTPRATRRVKILNGGRVDLAETNDRQPFEHHRERAALLRHYGIQVPRTKLNGCCAVEAGHLYFAVSRSFESPQTIRLSSNGV